MSPHEAAINNVRGRLMIAEAAARHKVERMVHTSVKAVDSGSVMGATERAGKYLMQSLSSRYPRTRFCSVRFGNVLGSRGGVLPLFRQQIEAGGPGGDPPGHGTLLHDHPRGREARAPGRCLADHAPGGSAGTQGPYVLDMGAPVRIVDVAHRMILLLNGKGEDTFVIFTDLRPGEKFTEELFCLDERPIPTSHPMIRVATRDSKLNVSDALPGGFQANLHHLISLAEQDAEPEVIVAALQLCVPSYVPLAQSPGPDDDSVCIFPQASRNAARLTAVGGGR